MTLETFASIVKLPPTYDTWCIACPIMFETLACFEYFFHQKISSFKVLCFEVLKYGAYLCPSFSNSNFGFSLI